MKKPVYKTKSLYSEIKGLFLRLFSSLLREFNTDSYYQYRLFRVFLYTWIVFNTWILATQGEYFWGKYSFVPEIELKNLNFLEKSFYLLQIPWLSNLYPFFIFLQILFSLLGIFNIWPRVSAFFIFFLTWNLNQKVFATLDGGDNIILLLLFYNLFIDSKKSLNSHSSHTADILSLYLSKAALIMGRIQVAIVYFTAGHLKLSGELWPKGLGLYYTFNIQEFSHPWLQSFTNQWPIVTILGSYFTLAFQLSFSFLIWFRAFNLPLIFIGSFIHLGIAFGMGLVSFGFAMVVSYSLFYTKELAKEQFLNLSFKNRLLVGIDEKCKICMKFQEFIAFFDWFKNIHFDKARKPKNPLLLDIEEKERTRTLYVYDYEKGLYFTGMKGIEVIVKNTCLKPFALFLFFLNALGIGEHLYTKFLAQGPFRKKCSEKDCIF